MSIEMNPIKRLFLSLSDEELKAAVADLKVLDEIGVVPPGRIAGLQARVVEVLPLSSSDARHVVMTEVIRQAAFRWAGVADQLEVDHGG